LSDKDPKELKARLNAFVGQPMGGLSTAPDPVNVPMIRHWVDALDDQNAIYLDESAASAGRFGGLVAPPAMLQTWTMGRPKIQGLAERGGAPTTFETNPISVLDDAGYTATRATDSELEFERYLAPGDELKSTSVVESISDEKKTALGPGFFVTWVTTYTDAKDQIVGRQLFRVLKFKPADPSRPTEDS